MGKFEENELTLFIGILTSYFLLGGGGELPHLRFIFVWKMSRATFHRC